MSTRRGRVGRGGGPPRQDGRGAARAGKRGGAPGRGGRLGGNGPVPPAPGPDSPSPHWWGGGRPRFGRPPPAPVGVATGRPQGGSGGAGGVRAGGGRRAGGMGAPPPFDVGEARERLVAPPRQLARGPGPRVDDGGQEAGIVGADEPLRLLLG